MTSYLTPGLLGVLLVVGAVACGGDEFVQAAGGAGGDSSQGGAGGSAGSGGSDAGAGGSGGSDAGAGGSEAGAGGSDAGAGGSGVVCAEGETACNGVCKPIAAFLSDPENCGGCKAKCLAPPGFLASCDGGKCGLDCVEGSSLCGSSCADLQNDTQNCGDCGKACPEPPGFKATCVQGACGTTCQGELSLCDGACTNLQTDPANCGACGAACEGGEVCLQGACGTSCGALTACDGACVELQEDPAHCGGCGNACPAVPGGTAICEAGTCGIACEEPSKRCNGVCVDTSQDPDNCGECNQPCPAAPDGAARTCSQGICGFFCEGGKANCDGQCVDPNSDGKNCGGCGNVCSDGQVCSLGQCTLNCASGETPCDGACIDTSKNVSHCGSCGNACKDPEGVVVPACNGGQCGLACPFGTLCGESCVSLMTDPANCGSCGKSCSSGQKCEAGACVLDCGGNTDCGGVCVVTQTNVNHCGACGNKCTVSAKEPTKIDNVGAPACVNSACDVACGAGRQSCKISQDFYCPKNNSPRFCGGECVACGAGQVCNAKQCKNPACAIDKKLCGNGVCTDLKIDRNNCGACGTPCQNNQVCEGGVCKFANAETCLVPFAACPVGNGIFACTDTNTDSNNCGGCGTVCPKTKGCSGGKCKDFYNALEPWECSLIPGFTLPCTITVGGESRLICIPGDDKCSLWGGNP